MKHALILFYLLITLSLWANGVIAQTFCAKGKPWSCFGRMEVSVSAKGENGTIRMYSFTNGDMMMEARGTNTDDVKLLALASGRRLYQGIPDEEIRNGFPFMFFDYGFAYPLQALQRIYPTGLKSVPEIETETPVVLEKQILTTLVVKRLSNDKVQYKLVMPMMTIKGFVEKERKPALPDNYELDRWKDETLRGYATLGEARVNRD